MHATIKDPGDLPAVLTAKDVMAFLGVARPTAYELMNRKDFPSIRIGRSLKVTKQALLAWLEQKATTEK